MINGKKIVVVMPAYNAEMTLEKVYSEIPFDIVDDIILVDDCSRDNTVELARKLKINQVLRHDTNKGYGANQKSCYYKALELSADIVIMLHPDYQYTPKLIASIAYMIANGVYDTVIASRIIGKGAIDGGMPVYKYFSNRILTFIQNVLMNQKLSEYHTGYRAFSAPVLNAINYTNNSDDFIFDNQMLAQILYKNFTVGEISCPTKYFREASSISFKRSITYGLGVLKVSFQYFLQKKFNIKSALF
ncbi:MAG: Undecaprenyl-phosphate 4-deoxy-4-formamido-L-arabinose transferase [Candidatus Ordinivivax streblomastigis]|uniref:Undecaprenyl-phosphate 4-deoxy-4-formamido-L-arabinose transferase n=1 Tax=Candidatus Ordinivivax streblomastigis TaxID=2540710 RepID=A0A5M8P2N2_9BACT|nr:MAG: Undecaprenyl-phosphate 4-deoxy-4-formamido-L-arabinose transferase [Candidatus Ordinivivax streblomastigis]